MPLELTRMEKLCHNLPGFSTFVDAEAALVAVLPSGRELGGMLLNEDRLATATFLHFPLRSGPGGLGTLCEHYP